MGKIAISSGHSKYLPGAIGPEPWGLHEHSENVRVVNQVAIEMRKLGVEVVTYEDTVSKSVSDNLDRLINWHNQQSRDADISVHFNAFEATTGAKGHECWYTSDSGKKIANAIVGPVCTASGLKNRGVKYTDELAFLNGTEMPACLIEVAFTDAKVDCDLYRAKFGAICSAIAGALAGKQPSPGPEPEPEPGVLFSAKGTVSWFGGPDDTGVSPSEGLAMWYEVDECPWLMLPKQPSGTSGMARRLDPSVFYLACRWDYDVTPKEMLRGSQMAMVTATKTGVSRLAHIADWGPHEEQTGRAADISPGLMENLGIDTDSEVSVIYPAP